MTTSKITKTNIIHACNKEDKIDSMGDDIKTLKRVVLTGNGSEGLVVMVTEIKESQESMKESQIKMGGDIVNIGTSISALAKFRTTIETAYKTRKETQDRMSAKYRWLIWILSSSIVGLLTAVVMLVISKT